MADKLVFYHNPMARGRIAHWLLAFGRILA
jgi:hypothetical protein